MSRDHEITLSTGELKRLYCEACCVEYDVKLEPVYVDAPQVLGSPPRVVKGCLFCGSKELVER